KAVFVDYVPDSLVLEHERSVGKLKEDGRVRISGKGCSHTAQELLGRRNMLEHMPADDEVGLVLRVPLGIVIADNCYSSAYLQIATAGDKGGVKTHPAIVAQAADQ